MIEYKKTEDRTKETVVQMREWVLRTPAQRRRLQKIVREKSNQYN